jgi:WD40 repeat protein
VRTSCFDVITHELISRVLLFSVSSIDHARTIAMNREKEKKAIETKAQRKALHPPSTPTTQKRLAPPGASSVSHPIHTSISSPSLSVPSSSTGSATVTSSKEEGDRLVPSPQLGADSDAVSSAEVAPVGDEDASLEQARLDQLNELGHALGSALKAPTAEDGDREDDDAAEPEQAEEDERKEDTEGRKESASSPSTNKSKPRAGSMDEYANEQVEEDRLTSLPVKPQSKKTREDGAQQAGDDWDMCEVPSTSSASSSNSGPSISAPTFNPASIYTSPMCTLVLPIGIIYGTLEISPHSLKFVHNPHAEQQLLQQQLIAYEQLAKTQAAEGGKVYPPPPPKAKPFTLPSLDALRNREKKDRVWPLNTIVAVYRRRYQLQKTALEIFLLDGRNYFLEFGSRNERKAVLRKILGLRPPRLIRLCSRSVTELLARSRLTEKWMQREMSNFEYIMHLNTVSSRTYNDVNQYPVFPWILSYYPEAKVKLEKVASTGSSSSSSSGSSSTPAPSVRAVEIKDPDEIDILDVIRTGPSHRHTAHVFRDLTKPMGALDEHRLEQILERFNTFFDTSIPPFHYGSHYSNAAIVLFYLMRLEPYASLHIELQAGKFDWSDRLFSSIGQTWKNCCTSLSCYKELIPEFFYSEVFLDNLNGYDLGVKQDGQLVSDVMLPTWANDSSAEFIRINRLALESEYVSQNLHAWIDLIFGYKQKGAAAKAANNLFFHLTYEGAVDIATIKDPVLLEAISQQISQFGQTPVQLFKKAHPQRMPLAQAKLQRLTLSTTLAQMLEQSDYHHPSLRRVLVSKDLAVQSIRAFSSKLYTVSANFVLGVHYWNAEASSEVEELAPGIPGRGQQPVMRRYALPFTYALAATQAYAKHNPVLSDGVLFTADGRLMFEGNNWDDSLRVYQSSSSMNLEALKRSGANAAPFGELKLTLSQSLIQHHDRVTQIALGRDDKTLVTASKDCTLLVWLIDVEEPSSRVSGIFREGQLVVRPAPRHILRGHEEPIIAVAVDSEMDVCVSISTRGQVLMHSLRKGQFLCSLSVPRVADVLRMNEAAHQRTIANATAAAVAATNGGVAPFPATSSSGSSLPPPFQVPPSREIAGVESLLSRARTGSILESPSQLHLAKLVAFAADGCIVFYSVVWDASTKRFMSPQMSCCSVNGRHWRAAALEEYLMCMAISADGKVRSGRRGALPFSLIYAHRFLFVSVVRS